MPTASTARAPAPAEAGGAVTPPRLPATPVACTGRVRAPTVQACTGGARTGLESVARAPRWACGETVPPSTARVWPAMPTPQREIPTVCTARVPAPAALAWLESTTPPPALQPVSLERLSAPVAPV